MNSPTGLSDAVRRLRRGLRDVRDRMARRSNRWRDVGFAGMIGGDGTTLVMVTHEGIDRREVEDVLRRRWPDVAVKALEQEEPAVAMIAGDAAAWDSAAEESNRCGSWSCPSTTGNRPSRPFIEPMPVLVRWTRTVPDCLTTLASADRLPWPGWSGWSHRSDLFTNPPR